MRPLEAAGALGTVAAAGDAMKAEFRRAGFVVVPGCRAGRHGCCPACLPIG